MRTPQLSAKNVQRRNATLSFLRDTEEVKKPPAKELMAMKEECRALAEQSAEVARRMAEERRDVSKRAMAQTRIWDEGSPHPEDARKEYLALVGRTVALQKEILDLTLAQKAEADSIARNVKSTSQFRIAARLQRFTEFRDWMTTELPSEVQRIRKLDDEFHTSVESLEAFVKERSSDTRD